MSKKQSLNVPFSALSAAALVAGAGLVSCEDVERTETAERKVQTQTEDAPMPATAPPVGGEGEGGVAIEAAADDPVVYGSALAIAKAHILAARDAHAAGQSEAAAEMFAHPAAEVLLDLEPILAARGIETFSDMFLDASEAIYAGESPDEIATRTQKIVTVINEALAKAPEDGRSQAAITVGIIADQLERAADMYAIAKDVKDYGPYLDGYGFYQAARAQMDGNTLSPEQAKTVQTAFSQFAKAYAAPVLPDQFSEEPGSLLALASRVALSAGAQEGR